jgi:hypothetical protein
MIRATKKIAYDMLREQGRARKEKKEAEPIIKVYATLADQVGIEHLRHRVGRREEYNLKSGAWYEFRKRLIQKFRLKELRWNLWARDGIAWVCLPKMPHVADGDELKVEVYARGKRTPNSPGASHRKHFERPNQRRPKRTFTWSPPQPRTSDVSTSVKLAPEGQVGYRELPELSPQEEAYQREARRTKALEVLQTRKEEIIKELGERSSRQAISQIEEEAQRLRREVESLERLKGAKQRLDDRDEWRQKKDEKFREMYVEPPPEKFVPRDEKERAVAAKKKKAEDLEAFKRELEEKRVAKAQRQEEKKAEGKARQAKAEQRTKSKRGKS